MELGCITLLEQRCLHQPRNSLNPILLGFCGGFLLQARPIIDSISSPSNLFGEWGLRLKIPSFESWLGLSGHQPPSKSHPGAHPESPHQNKRYPYCSCYQEFLRVLGTVFHKSGQRTNIYFLSQITTSQVLHGTSAKLGMPTPGEISNDPRRSGSCRNCKKQPPNEAGDSQEKAGKKP